MTKRKRSAPGAEFFVALPLCLLLLAAGCSKQEGTASSSAPTGAPPPGAQMGGPGGPPGPGGPGGGRMRGGPGGPMAANASGAQIYQQKCQGCHGDKGQGAKGPALKVASHSDAELRKTIGEGHRKMPAFKAQLTSDQITRVIAYVKQLK